MSASTLDTPPRETNYPIRLPAKIYGAQQIQRQAQEGSVFVGALLEANAMRRPKRMADYALSLVLHTGVIAVLLLLPLYFTQGLNIQQLTATFLVAPPPPPPPPAAAHLRQIEKPRFISDNKLYEPQIIPKKIDMVKEEPPPDAAAGVTGGVPGGMPGGQLGGVIGGILSGIPTGILPPATKPTAPIPIGGNVKRPQAIYAPDPVYPVIARIAHVQGDVIIDSTIDERGNVIGMKVVSGQKLLVPAALAALSHWRFEPTYLNGQPVAVEFHVTIEFHLTE